MNSPAPDGGSIFHALLRACLSEQRSPTDDELNIVASKIWHEGFAASSGKRWQDLAPQSAAHIAMLNAAKGALGVRAGCRSH